MTEFSCPNTTYTVQCNSAQDESISMNIKLKNLRSAEEDLGKFLGNVVVTAELATSICGDEVNDAYLENVIELNNKVNEYMRGSILLYFPAIYTKLILLNYNAIILMRT